MGEVVVPDVPVTDLPVTEVLEVLDIQEFLEILGELIGPVEDIPNFLDVPFAEYSVTDGLLLLLLLSLFMAALWHFVKGVF